MIAAGDDIEADPDYLEAYYGHSLFFVNRGGATLVSPKYAKLFHRIFFQICVSLNKTTLIDQDDEKPMVHARAKVMGQLPEWVKELQEISGKELKLEDPTKTCRSLLATITRTNMVLKRYQSTHLARGGKKAVKSSLRDDLKHMGKGSRK